MLSKESTEVAVIVQQTIERTLIEIQTVTYLAETDVTEEVIEAAHSTKH